MQHIRCVNLARGASIKRISLDCAAVSGSLDHLDPARMNPLVILEEDGVDYGFNGGRLALAQQRAELRGDTWLKPTTHQVKGATPFCNSL